jgi:anti-anti-sigma factor
MESIVTVVKEEAILKVNIKGKLDAVKAPELMDEFKKYMNQGIDKIVFYGEHMEYMSSAGLRTLIFAKQKLGSNVEVYLIKPQEAVLEVINMSGLDSFLKIADTF